MLHFLFLSLLCVTAWAVPLSHYYSYSVAVGTGSGTSFSTEAEGHITAVRLWDTSNSYVRGIQFRYGFDWGPVIGRALGTAQEMELFPGEVIVQASGKYSSYIQQLVFTTSRGRSIYAGQPGGTSFNFYPKHPESELWFLSGMYNSNGVLRLGAHWGVVYAADSSTEGHPQ